MTIQHTTQAFHLRPFTERKRLSAPRVNHDEEMFPYHPAPGVPKHLQPIHRNLWTSAFPYKKAMDYPGQFEVQELPVVRLENEFARVTVMPSIAGRVMEVFDKKLNRQLLWTPPSLPLANLSLSGPWSIGGIEFNPFRYGHNVHGISTIETRKVTLADGREAIAMGAFDELFGCGWEVILTLEKGTLVSRMTITNHSGKDQPSLYWWTCIAVPQQWRDRVMMAPGDFLHHAMFRQGYEFHQWPMVHGVDWSQWLHQHEVVSGYLPNTASDFMGYTNEKEGWSFVHRADRSICKGRKLWSLGSQGVHQTWWQSMAEPNWVPYAEIQCGLLPTQPDTGILKAGESISWTESFCGAQGASTGADYAQNFSAFEQRGIEKTGKDWAAWNDSAFWRITKSETLIAEDERLAISRKLILTGKLDESEIARAIELGWVGGDEWIRLLSEKQNDLSDDARLALAVALINANEPDKARALLTGLAEIGGETAAYANHFLAQLSENEGKTAEALEQIRRSVGEGYADTHLIATADQMLSRMGRHEERKALWQNAPAETRATDDCRLAQANLAQLDGDWKSVRTLLKEPLLSIAEGASTAWFLYKESFFGEFAELCGKGEFNAALDILARGSEAAPQFGIGRQEERQNVDFLYYRYQLCKAQGWDYLASAFANMILLEPEYPGSPEALYVLRVALAENDPTAAARREKIEAWNREADAEWAKYQPLRWALCRHVLDGSVDGWQGMQSHPIFGIRAGHELEKSCIQAPNHSHRVGSSQSSPAHEVAIA
jgi:hypothetical protein